MRPKLWNGPNAMGEGLVRGLELTDSPFLSAHTADGVYAGVMDGKGEVKFKEEDPIGGFISRPQAEDFLDPTYWGAPHTDEAGNKINPPLGTVGGTKPFVWLKPKYVSKTKVASEPYKVNRRQPENYGTVDWQGRSPKDVLSWYATSWVGPAASRLSQGWINPASGGASASGGAERVVSPIRYQCVGSGMTIYRGLKVFRQATEVVHGAALVRTLGVKRCIAVLGTDELVRIGFLDRDGTFTEIKTHSQMTSAHVMSQGWYFNQSGERAVCIYTTGTASYVVEFVLGGGETLFEVQATSSVTVIENNGPSFTYETTNRLIENSASSDSGSTEDYNYEIQNSDMSFVVRSRPLSVIPQARIGRDYVGDDLTRLDQVTSQTAQLLSEVNWVRFYETRTYLPPTIRSSSEEIITTTITSTGEGLDFDLAASGGRSFVIRSIGAGGASTSRTETKRSHSDVESFVDAPSIDHSEGISISAGAVTGTDKTFDYFRLLYADLRSGVVAGIHEVWVKNYSITHVLDESGPDPMVDTTAVTTELRSATFKVYADGVLEYSEAIATGGGSPVTTESSETFFPMDGASGEDATFFNSGSAYPVPGGNNFYLGINDEFFGASYFTASFLSGFLTFDYNYFAATATAQVIAPSLLTGLPYSLSNGTEIATVPELTAIDGYDRARFWRIGVI